MARDDSERIMRIVGVGDDQRDGHVRISRGRDFEVFFGSDEVHADMRELCRKIETLAEQRGKKIRELSKTELLELLGEIEGS